MNIDGECRIAFLKDQAPDLQFGVAPLPVTDPAATARATSPATSSASRKTAKNPEAAWALIKYLTTDTSAIVKLANGIKNVPTTTDALASPDLRGRPGVQGVPGHLRQPEHEHHAAELGRAPRTRRRSRVPAPASSPARRPTWPPGWRRWTTRSTT